MPFLAATCVDHGQAGTSPGDSCCAGLNKWAYDANTGTAYDTFMCWTASCAAEGQWAGPNGVGNHCCSPFVNFNGKCATPSSSNGGSTTLPAVCVGTLICSIPDMVLYAAGGLLVLVLFMSKKKKAA